MNKMAGQTCLLPLKFSLSLTKGNFSSENKTRKDCKENFLPSYGFLALIPSPKTKQKKELDSSKLLAFLWDKCCFSTQTLVFVSSEYTVGKGEIAHNEQFLLFPQSFLPIWRTSNLKLWSANSFSLDLSEILLFGKGLNGVLLSKSRKTWLLIFNAYFSNNILRSLPSLRTVRSWDGAEKFNPLPQNPNFSRPCERSLLKTL